MDAFDVIVRVGNVEEAPQVPVSLKVLRVEVWTFGSTNSLLLTLSRDAAADLSEKIAESLCKSD